jgi:hypothetical protein
MDHQKQEEKGWYPIVDWCCDQGTCRVMLFSIFIRVLCNLYLSSQLHVRYRLCKVILSICSVVCKETFVSLKSIGII